MPRKRKKMRQEKRKKREGEKVKSNTQDCCVTFKPQNYRKICKPIFASQYFASGSEGRKVYNL